MKIDGGRASSFCDDRELAEAALEGEELAVKQVKEMVESPQLRAMLLKRGGSPTEVEEIVADLLGDCFGGEQARGGMYRLLGKFHGSGALGAFLNRVALNRLISLKRKSRVDLPIKEENRDGEDGVVLAAAGVAESEDDIMELLRESVMEAFASVDQERLVLFRMVQSYGISQKRVGEMWGWHESKVSRAMASLLEEIRELIMQGIQSRDPWLQLEWEDFLAMCGETVDLFDY